MKTKKSPAIKSIAIVGRRWFQRTYGNTYHTAEIYVNGEMVHKAGEQYGYGEQYLETALQWLEANGYMTRRKYANGGHEALYQWEEREGVKVSRSVSDVARERDL